MISPSRSPCRAVSRRHANCSAGSSLFARIADSVCGVGLDRDKGWIYVSNRQGKLLRIAGVLPDASAQS
ncbi:hypothetical protein [Streptomyces lydicus]|uniref:hypothetical protein n=1 Tax=Streptomyces lydicus TaxID=47763 RepID=UPI003791FFC3